MVELAPRGLGPSPSRRRRSLEFELIFWVSFLVFLVAAIAGRLVPGHTRQATGSIVAEARAAAHTFVPMVFMG